MSSSDCLVMSMVPALAALPVELVHNSCTGEPASTRNRMHAAIRVRQDSFFDCYKFIESDLGNRNSVSLFSSISIHLRTLFDMSMRQIQKAALHKAMFV